MDKKWLCILNVICIHRILCSKHGRELTTAQIMLKFFQILTSEFAFENNSLEPLTFNTEIQINKGTNVRASRDGPLIIFCASVQRYFAFSQFEVL